MYSTSANSTPTSAFDNQYKGERKIPAAANSALRSRARVTRHQQKPKNAIATIQNIPANSHGTL